MATKVKKPDIDALLDEADRLLGETVPQLEQATKILRKIVVHESEHLLALHWLNWTLDATRRVSPGAWERETKAEHWDIRDRVLALTKGVRPTKDPGDPQKARALALSQWCEERLQGAPTAKTLDDVEAAMAEGKALRPLPDYQRAERGLFAWRSVLAGPKGFEALLDWVKKHPRHSFVGDEGDAKAVPAALQGMEDAFAAPAFLAWLRAQKPAKTKEKEELDKGLVLAAGGDAKPFFGPDGRSRGRIGRVLALRALGGNLEVKDRAHDGTLLHLAASVDDAVLVEELLALGLSPAAVDSRKATALHVAAEYECLSVIPVLAKAGVPVDALDGSGRTALFDAKTAAIADALLAAGADPNAGKKTTALVHHAGFVGRAPVVERLLAAGADPTRTNTAGKTALEEAKAARNPDVVKLLSGGAPTAGALELSPLVEAFAKQREALLKAWYIEEEHTDDVERMLESMRTAASWDEAAGLFADETPWTAMAVVNLAKKLPTENAPQPLKAFPRFVRGDLTVKGDLRVTGVLFVTGDLVVEGLLRDMPESLLVVGGSLKARGLDTEGEVVVDGALQAELVWGRGNDHSLRVGRGIEAQVVVEDDHDVQAKVKAKQHLKSGRFDPEAPTLRKKFVAEAFVDGRLDADALFGLVSRNLSILG